MWIGGETNSRHRTWTQWNPRILRDIYQTVKKTTSNVYSAFTALHESDVCRYTRHLRGKKQAPSKTPSLPPQHPSRINELITCPASKFWHQRMKSMRQPLNTGCILSTTNHGGKIKRAHQKRRKCARKLLPKWRTRCFSNEIKYLS